MKQFHLIQPENYGSFENRRVKELALRQKYVIYQLSHLDFLLDSRFSLLKREEHSELFAQLFQFKEEGKKWDIFYLSYRLDLLIDKFYSSYGQRRQYTNFYEVGYAIRVVVPQNKRTVPQNEQTVPQNTTSCTGCDNNSCECGDNRYVCFCGKPAELRGVNSDNQAVLLCNEHHTTSQKFTIDTSAVPNRDAAKAVFALAIKTATNLGLECSSTETFTCDECRTQLGSGDKRFACTQGCNYDACENCFKKSGHEHELEKVVIS